MSTSTFGGRPVNVILVHDYLNQHGGAERVLEAMHGLYPEAPVYTSIYDPEAMPDYYREWDIRTTWIDRVPGSHTHHQWLLAAYPSAFSGIDVPDCDLVLSSSSAFAKLVHAPAGAIHVCYTHAPGRFAWAFDQYCEREAMPGWIRPMLRPYMARFRGLDRKAASRVDYFIANSTVVRDRIRAFWRRDAEVIHPPVDVERFEPAPLDEIGDYFLVISRLVPYKRIDLVIEAFNRLGLPLWIAGDGRDRSRLKNLAGSNVRFLGRLSDDELSSVTARCRAAVFMSEDDFGIAQVEVQAAGRPVIALARGGVLDSVRPNETGIWVSDRTPAALIDAVRRFETVEFDIHRLRAHAMKFSAKRFQQQLQETIDVKLRTYHDEGQHRWS